MALEWYLQKRKQQAIAYQQRMEEERRRQVDEKERLAAIAAQQSNEILEQNKKVNDDIAFLLNSPLPHFNDESPPTIQELFESPYHLAIGKKGVVEDGVAIWIPTLVAKDGNEVVGVVNLCDRINTTKGFGNLYALDTQPIQRMIDHHNQFIKRNEEQ